MNIKKQIQSDISGAGETMAKVASFQLLPETVLHQIHENKGRQFEYTIALLQDQALLPKPLIADLRRIHRYYECCVNCTPLSVSREMCLLIRKVCACLGQANATLPGKL